MAKRNTLYTTDYKREKLAAFDALISNGMTGTPAAREVGHTLSMFYKWRKFLAKVDGTQDTKVIVHKAETKVIRRPSGRKSDKLVAIIGTASDIADIIGRM